MILNDYPNDDMNAAFLAFIFKYYFAVNFFLSRNRCKKMFISRKDTATSTLYQINGFHGIYISVAIAKPAPHHYPLRSCIMFKFFNYSQYTICHITGASFAC
jgi:hypothetical protein